MQQKTQLKVNKIDLVAFMIKIYNRIIHELIAAHTNTYNRKHLKRLERTQIFVAVWVKTKIM